MEFVSPNIHAQPDTVQAHVAIPIFGRGDELDPRPRSADWTIDQAAFDELLCWLDPDPETAGRQYELIRRKLITVFAYKGCAFPDELADETFNRVARKLLTIKPYYSGSPVRYFFGVAKRIYMEYLRKSHAQPIMPQSNLREDLEESLQHLENALSKLSQSDRELILNYYLEDGRSKIDHRKALAIQMGLHLNALRLRVYRIRSQLRKYLESEKLEAVNYR
jgi:DNA-directed RNA polymerase specialized sigma24 family protein